MSIVWPTSPTVPATSRSGPAGHLPLPGAVFRAFSSIPVVGARPEQWAPVDAGVMPQRRHLRASSGVIRLESLRKVLLLIQVDVAAGRVLKTAKIGRGRCRPRPLLVVVAISSAGIPASAEARVSPALAMVDHSGEIYASFAGYRLKNS